MSHKTINVGTVANDGTGDTIRGAFTNVNANFTEVYSNISNLTATVAGIDLGQNTTIQSSYNTANSAFDKANAANVLAYNVGVNANIYSNVVGASSNSYSNVVGSAGNSVATIIGTSGNSYTVSVGAAGNAYSQSIGAASNTWANGAYTLATGAYNWANTLVDAANSYSSILAANNGIGANGWTNTVSTATYSWANTKFDTVTNTSIILAMANGAYIRANNSLANNVANGYVTLVGSLTVTGLMADAIGSVRERLTITVSANTTANSPYINFISNSSSLVHIKIPDDNTLLLSANIGTTIDVYQFGTGTTKIVANDASVTVRSSNNWANIAGQYLSASVVKVLPNTWILTGDLKP